MLIPEYNDLVLYWTANGNDNTKYDLDYLFDEGVMMAFWDVLFYYFPIYLNKCILENNYSEEIYILLQEVKSDAIEREIGEYLYFSELSREFIEKNEIVKKAYCIQILFKFMQQENLLFRNHIDASISATDLQNEYPGTTFTVADIFNHLCLEACYPYENNMIHEMLFILFKKNKKLVHALTLCFEKLKHYYLSNETFCKIIEKDYTKYSVSQILSPFYKFWQSDYSRFISNRRNERSEYVNNFVHDLYEKNNTNSIRTKPMEHTHLFRYQKSTFDISKYILDVECHLLKSRKYDGISEITLPQDPLIAELCLSIDKALEQWLSTYVDSAKNQNDIAHKVLYHKRNRLKFLPYLISSDIDGTITYLPYIITNFLLYNFNSKVIPHKSITNSVFYEVLTIENLEVDDTFSASERTAILKIKKYIGALANYFSDEKKDAFRLSLQYLYVFFAVIYACNLTFSAKSTPPAVDYEESLNLFYLSFRFSKEEEFRFRLDVPWEFIQKTLYDTNYNIPKVAHYYLTHINTYFWNLTPKQRTKLFANPLDIHYFTEPQICATYDKRY